MGPPSATSPWTRYSPPVTASPIAPVSPNPTHHHFPLQIDLLIQETSRLLQLTIEHDPHETLGREPGLVGSPLPAPCSPLRSPDPTPCGDPTAMRQRAVT